MTSSKPEFVGDVVHRLCVIFRTQRKITGLPSTKFLIKVDVFHKLGAVRKAQQNCFLRGIRNISHARKENCGA